MSGLIRLAAYFKAKYAQKEDTSFGSPISAGKTRVLKSVFNYTTKLIDTLNTLKNAIVGEKISREELLLLDAAIKNVQDHIWEESKRILNIHDLRGILLDFPQLEGILEKPPVPTWDFGPGKSPASKSIRRRWDRAKDLMKRLEQENSKEEEAAKQRKRK